MQHLIDQQYFALHYNCSFYDYNAEPFTLENRRHIPIGITLFCLYAAFELLYLPCLAVFARAENRRESCYALMLFMGVLSMMNLHSSGFIVGIYAFRGDTFCSRPLFNYIIGMPLFALFLSETMTALVLALNRCVEMWDSHRAAILFGGRRVYFWMAGILLYGFGIGLFTIPPVPNGPLVVWSWNPHIPYFDDPELVYNNIFFSTHNICIALGLPLIYAIFYLLMHRKLNVVAAVAPAVGSLQKAKEVQRRKANVSIQVFLISLLHMIHTLSYVYMQYFPVTPLLIIAVSFEWIGTQGLIPVIYICFNKYIRRSVKNLLMFNSQTHTTATSGNQAMGGGAAGITNDISNRQ